MFNEVGREHQALSAMATCNWSSFQNPFDAVFGFNNIQETSGFRKLRTSKSSLLGSLEVRNIQIIVEALYVECVGNCIAS